MHATAANLLTCCHGSCSQPATVAVVVCRPPTVVTLAVDGREWVIEHDATIVDFCPDHAPED